VEFDAAAHCFLLKTLAQQTIRRNAAADTQAG
jgi:hypothetical protein